MYIYVVNFQTRNPLIAANTSRRHIFVRCQCPSIPRHTCLSNQASSKNHIVYASLEYVYTVYMYTKHALKGLASSSLSTSQIPSQARTKNLSFADVPSQKDAVKCALQQM